jgi:hypothetical protein
MWFDMQTKMDEKAKTTTNVRNVGVFFPPNYCIENKNGEGMKKKTT